MKLFKPKAKPQKQRLILKLCASAAFLLQPVIADDRPNIIIFYVDDLGWQDVQLNDVDEPCAYETPNIIKLAQSGMNFTQGYSPAPTCSPSRAGIITGQHPAKMNFTHVTLGNIKPASKNVKLLEPYLELQLDRNLLTIADAMKDNGYRTGHSGKWHVGLNAASYGFETVNQERGIHRGVPDRTKGFATADDPKIPLSKEKYPPMSEKKPEGISYPFDEVTASAIDFIAESKEQPFFLNLCHWMVHWPMLTRNGELLEYYCDKFGQPFPPKPGDMTLPGQQNPYFASMVTSVDWSLGQVVDFLQKTEDPRSLGKKLIETTYIFFTSDNGGAEKRGKEILSDNAPLKYGKSNPEDGGIRVPLVVTGPGIKPGSSHDNLVNQLDFFPTILSVTGAEIAAEAKAELSGLDIAPVLHGKSSDIMNAEGKAREHLFWHFPHGSQMKSAIRSGDFKLYKRYETDDYELYRLTKDGERNDYEEEDNLIENPEFSSVADRLKKLLEEELTLNNAELPYLNPIFKENDKAAAILGKSSYNADTREVKIAIKPSEVNLKKAFVIYEPKAKKERSKKFVDIPVSKALPGMKVPATIDSDGLSVTAVLPKEITSACFMIVDENHHLQYSKTISAE